jgi:hypothetical protein
MFCIDLSDTFATEVRFGVPGTDGATQVCAFTAQLRRLDRDQMDALAKQAAEEAWDDRRMATELLRGWGSDVVNASGHPLPYTPDNVKRVLSTPNAAEGVLRAHRRANEEAALGN